MSCMEIKLNEKETIILFPFFGNGGDKEISWFNHHFIIGEYRRKVEIIRDGDNLDPELDDYFSSLGNEIVAGLHYPEKANLEDYLKKQLGEKVSLEIIEFVKRNLELKKKNIEEKKRK